MQVKNARPQEKIYRLFDGGGLYLEVTPQGSKLWRMKFRQPNGKENRLSFGKYPDVSLEQARQKRGHRISGERKTDKPCKHVFSRLFCF